MLTLIYTLSLHDALPIWDLGEFLVKGLSVKGMISYDSYATSAEQGSKLERLYIANVDYDRDELSYTISRPDEERLSVNRDRKSTRLNPVTWPSRMPSSA